MYEHVERTWKKKIFKDVVIVSACDHVLPVSDRACFHVSPLKLKLQPSSPPTWAVASHSTRHDSLGNRWSIVPEPPRPTLPTAFFQGQTDLLPCGCIFLSYLVLQPGEWQYPFVYKIPEHVPGVVKFKKEENFQDPHYRHGKKETAASIVFSLKAVLESAGMFSRELKSRSEIVVNPYFNW